MLWVFRAGSGSGKVLVSRGCCRGCARVSNASPRSMCLPGNRSTAGRSATGITKTVGQRGVGALGVAVAGYQRQLARCFVVHSDAAHSARAAPSRMSTSNTALKSLCRALLCSLREDLKSKVRDLSRGHRDPLGSDHGQHPDPQRQRNKSCRGRWPATPWGHPEMLPGVSGVVGGVAVVSDARRSRVVRCADKRPDHK